MRARGLRNTLSPDEKADDHGIGDIDEEGGYERQDDEGRWRRTMHLRHRRHVRDCSRGRAKADAAKPRRDHRRLIVTTHRRKDGKEHVGNGGYRLYRQYYDERRAKPAERPELHTHQ